MSLTVPRAGVTAGRSATVRVEAADQTGGAVAQFGETIREIGGRMETDRLDRHATRLQIDMTRELGDLRLQTQQLNDPDQIDQQWSSQSRLLRQKYLDGQDEDGRPITDPKIRDRVGMAFDDLANKHAFALGSAAIEARRTQRSAQWLEYSDTVVRQSAGVDQSTRDTLVGQAIDKVNADLAANLIDPVEAARRRIDIRENSEGAAAIEHVDGDPAGFLAATEAGGYSGLDPEVRARYRVQAQGALDRQIKAEAEAADAAAKERDRQIGARLDEIADIAGTGQKAVDEAWLASPEVQAHPEFGKTQAAIDLRNEKPDLAFKTPAELDAMIAEEKATPKGRKYQTERLAVLTGFRDKASEAWRTDPVAQAAAIGMPVPDLPDVTAATPQEIGAAIAARVTFGQHLVDKGYVKSAPVLSQQEQDALKSAIGIDTDPARRVELARALTMTLGTRNPDALAGLTDDPVFTFVGGYAASRGSPAVAAEVFRGQQVIKENNIVMPPLKDRIKPVFLGIGSAFGQLPGGEKLRSSIVATTDALYAARQPKPAADIDETIYKQALHEVLGGTGVTGSREAAGGVQEINGSLVPLPMGVRGRDVEQTFDRLTDLLTPGHWDGQKVVYTPEGQAKGFAALSFASPTGQVPYVGAKPLDVATFQKLQMQAVGQDRYRLVFRAKSGVQFVTDSDGAAFEFSLTSLMRRLDE